MNSIVKTFFITALLATCLVFTRGELYRSSSNNNTNEKTPLYLPKIEAVELFTLGYQKPASDIFWFLTLNYFGEQYQKKASMPWFSHMCDLVTSLDSNASHVYEFCGTLLSWIAKEPENSNKILNKGIKANPNNWKLYYLKGFNEWYFLEDFNKAKETLKISSSLDGAPPMIANLAAKISSAYGSPEEAINFLRESLRTTKDPIASIALEKKLKEAYVARDILILNKVLAKFYSDTTIKPNSWEELVSAHYLKQVPKDPNGDIYEFNLDPLETKSKTLAQGLVFRGKTARTGIFKNEW